MGIWIFLVIGIIVGWLVEWIIDWLFWRRNVAGFYARESALSSDLAKANEERADLAGVVERLRATVVSLSAEKDALQKLVAEKDALAAQVAEKEAVQAQSVEKEWLGAQIAELKAAIAGAVAAKPPRRAVRREDDLERIEGITADYEQLLYAANIKTFAKLAATSPDRLRQIIPTEISAESSAASTAEGTDEIPAEISDESAVDINVEEWIAQARQLAAAKLADAVTHRLETIKGIGPAYAARLNQAGIMSFADIANASEEELRNAVAPHGGRNIDFADWITQAKAATGMIPGNEQAISLEEINGIGPVFATRLREAGIENLKDLAQASEETLQEVVGTDVRDLRRWIAAAKVIVKADDATPPSAGPASEESETVANETEGDSEESVAASELEA